MFEEFYAARYNVELIRAGGVLTRVRAFSYHAYPALGVGPNWLAMVGVPSATSILARSVCTQRSDLYSARVVRRAAYPCGRSFKLAKVANNRSTDLTLIVRNCRKR